MPADYSATPQLPKHSQPKRSIKPFLLTFFVAFSLGYGSHHLPWGEWAKRPIARTSSDTALTHKSDTSVTKPPKTENTPSPQQDDKTIQFDFYDLLKGKNQSNQLSTTNKTTVTIQAQTSEHKNTTHLMTNTYYQIAAYRNAQLATSMLQRLKEHHIEAEVRAFHQDGAPTLYRIVLLPIAEKQLTSTEITLHQYFHIKRLVRAT